MHRYWRAGPDWYWLKAQLIQESRLDPDAVSPAGAEGIAQFMPPTWAEVADRLGYDPGVTPFAPVPAINAAAAYMFAQQRFWSSPRPQLERHFLALANYNAGGGNVVKAQRLCSMALTWDLIEPCLDLVTGRHAEETRTYIRRIKGYQAELRK